MREETIDTQLLNYFHSLAKPQQLDALNYLKSLIKKEESSNKSLLALAGSISKKDLALMDKAIKEECNKIDEDEW